jgi:chaperone protein EcpD
MLHFMVYRLLILMAAWSLCGVAAAGVTLVNNRIVYPSNARQVDLVATNDTGEASLIQVWTDDGDQTLTPDNAITPFTISPPLARVMPGTSQTLRIIHTGGDLPMNKESLFWFNLLDTPPKPKGDGEHNFIQFAMRSRFKMFYRPVGLPGSAFSAPSAMGWKLDTSHTPPQLEGTNNSPFFINLARIQTVRGSQATAEFLPTIVPPFQSKVFPLHKSEEGLNSSSAVKFQFIDDYGAYRDVELPLTLP